MFDGNMFANNLRQARKRRGMSQRELAEKLFLSPQAVSRWEQGDATPDISRLCDLAAVLQTSVDCLLGASDGGEVAYIGIDGGGTKTEFVLLSRSGQMLKRVVLPGSNPNICTVEGACEVLRSGIDTMLQQERRVLGVFLGGSGMSSGGNGKAVENLLRDHYPGLVVQCETDICNLLAFADDPDNAIAVICGTGSVAFATRDGVLQRFGGGGWKLETDGSGYDLGRQAILAALEHRDGTGKPTVLTEAVEEKLGGKVWLSISKIYAESTSYIASFAPMVLSAWQQGDEVAAAIVERNCARIRHLILTAAEHSPRARQVLLGGSVVMKSQAFREHLFAPLPQTLEATVPQYPQVFGACLRCAAMLSLPRPDAEIFMKQYVMEE